MILEIHPFLTSMIMGGSVNGIRYKNTRTTSFFHGVKNVGCERNRFFVVFSVMYIQGGPIPVLNGVPPPISRVCNPSYQFIRPFIDLEVMTPFTTGRGPPCVCVFVLGLVKNLRHFFCRETVVGGWFQWVGGTKKNSNQTSWGAWHGLAPIYCWGDSPPWNYPP